MYYTCPKIRLTENFELNPTKTCFSECGNDIIFKASVHNRYQILVYDIYLPFITLRYNNTPKRVTSCDTYLRYITPKHKTIACVDVEVVRKPSAILVKIWPSHDIIPDLSARQTYTCKSANLNFKKWGAVA